VHHKESYQEPELVSYIHGWSDSMWAQARAVYSGPIQMISTLMMTVPRTFIPTVSGIGLVDNPGAKTWDRCDVKRRPFCQLIQATVFHPVLRLISRTIRHPVFVRFTAQSSLSSSGKGLAVVGISLQDVLAKNPRSVPLSVIVLTPGSTVGDVHVLSSSDPGIVTRFS